MNERLKELRSTLGLSQKDFSQKITIGSSTLAMLETGQRNIRDIHVSQICREFNVSEEWLRTGEGEMFVQTASTAIDQLAREYHLDNLDKKILNTYVQLSVQNRLALKTALVKLAHELASAPEGSEQMTIDEEVEAYRRELEAARKGATSPPAGA